MYHLSMLSATGKSHLCDIHLYCHQQKHVSSFIIQCNWTRVRVYRYLVSQQKHHAQKAVKAVTHSWVFLPEMNALAAAMYGKIYTNKISNKINAIMGARVQKRACVYCKLSNKKTNKNSKVAYLWSCIVGISKLRERHSCFFCYHQQYSSPLIDCNQFYFKSTVLHTFPRTAFRSIINDFTHRRETLGWHQLQIVLYEWIIPPKDPIRNEIKRH